MSGGGTGSAGVISGMSIEQLANTEGPPIVATKPAAKKAPTDAQKKEAEKLSRWGHGGGALPTQMDEDEE